MSKREPTPSQTPDVLWHLHGDAFEPKRAPWGFVAANPVQRAVPPGLKMIIDTGVAANVPMLAFPRGDAADYITVDQHIPAGQTVRVTVENKSKHSPLIIDDREALVNLHPLIFTGTAGKAD